jgi:hypothetical protein
MKGEGAWGRRAFLDLGYLVRNQTMRLAVYGLGRFFVGGFYEAEDLARSLVEPVPVVSHPVLGLDLLVLSVGLGYGVSGQPFHGREEAANDPTAKILHLAYKGFVRQSEPEGTPNDVR